MNIHEMGKAYRVLTAFSFLMQVVTTVVSNASEKKPADASSVYDVRLPDGGSLMMRTRLKPTSGRQIVDVSLGLYPKGVEHFVEGPAWAVDFTSLDYTPGSDRYYALVDIVDDRIFVFATWNGQYSIVDKRTGIILKRGADDEVLRTYIGLTPLRLDIIAGPQTGRTVVPTKEEEEEILREAKELEDNNDFPIHTEANQTNTQSESIHVWTEGDRKFTINRSSSLFRIVLNSAAGGKIPDPHIDGPATLIRSAKITRVGLDGSGTVETVQTEFDFRVTDHGIVEIVYQIVLPNAPAGQTLKYVITVK